MVLLDFDVFGVGLADVEVVLNDVEVVLGGFE